jgi:hypothetical protein
VNAPGRTISVLIIDDGHSAATYDLWFAEDLERRAAAARPLDGIERYGDVVGTPHAGRAALLAAMNDGVMPDLVLIDFVLSTGGAEPRPVAAGLDLMSWLRDERAARGEQVPCAVLWTAEYRPGMAYAFVQRGGAHAVSRTTPVGEVIELLWRVHDSGERWEHTWGPPMLELTPALIALLPYLEADVPAHEIAARIALTADQVNDRRGELKRRVNALRERAGLPRLDGNGLSSSLARYALKHGHTWVPLAYREDNGRQA